MSENGPENRPFSWWSGRSSTGLSSTPKPVDLVPLGKLRKVDVRNQSLRVAFCMDGGSVEKSRNWSAEIGLLGGPLVDGGESEQGSETRLPKSPEMEAF
jgi:hypothetical protein